MTEWPKATIGGACTVFSGGTPSKGNAAYWRGPIPWVSAKDLKSDRIFDAQLHISQQACDESAVKVAPTGSLLILVRGMGLANGIQIAEVTSPVAFNQDLRAIVPPNGVDPRFLMLALRHRLADGGKEVLSSAAHGTLKIDADALRQVEFPMPAMQEQLRIVAILNEAFDGIATAKANAVKNLKNAKELFDSHAKGVFMHGSDLWSTKKLDQISTNLDSKRVPITKSDRKVGEFPYYGASGVVDYVADYLFDGDALLISEDGANLLARSTPIAFSVSGRYWVNNHAHILKFDHIATQRFVEFFLESIPLDEYITGAAQPKLNQKALNSIPIMIPDSVSEQAKIVDKLDKMAEQSEHLQEMYEQKIAALDELKRSFLKQAFTGQFTSTKQVRIAQQAVLQTTTAQFAAAVISLAYARHERQNRERTFGRVKEQKTLHLVEAIGKIDLGRQPIRDAAGPNDFQHMLRAEEWARAHNFFEMIKREGGYDFKRLSAFDEHFARARETLKLYLQRLERAIDLLVPMDKEDAEVFATVHAAWNNLLIDGHSVTDDAIMSAAREDWHADKLRIPQQKFRNAIALIRREGVVPDGTAKYVGGQQSLL